MDIPKPPKPLIEKDVAFPPAPAKPPERPAPVVRVERDIKPASTDALKLSEGKKYPPLFIKLDKYGEVVDSIQKLKSTALGLRDALDALDDVEKELRNGLSITQKALDSFNTVLTTLDSRLLKVEHMDEPRPSGEAKAARREVNAYIRDVYDQIEKIKGELKSIPTE
jgi:hypothetical protein